MGKGVEGRGLGMVPKEKKRKVRVVIKAVQGGANA